MSIKTVRTEKELDMKTLTFIDKTPTSIAIEAKLLFTPRSFGCVTDIHIEKMLKSGRAILKCDLNLMDPKNNAEYDKYFAKKALVLNDSASVELVITEASDLFALAKCGLVLRIWHAAPREATNRGMTLGKKYTLEMAKKDFATLQANRDN